MGTNKTAPDPAEFLRISATAQCLSCGYTLAGLDTPRCPECGTEFDPTDPLTFRDPLNQGPRRRALLARRQLRNLRTPTRRWLVLMIGATLLLAHEASNFGLFQYLHRRRPSVGLIDLVAAVATIVLAIVAFKLLRSWQAGQWLRVLNFDPPRPSRSDRRRQHLLVALVLLAFSFVVYPWPLAIRFAYSRPALQALADETIALSHGISEPRRAGLFHVRETSLITAGQVFMYLADPDVGFSLTFAYSGYPSRFGLLYEPDDRGWQQPRRICCFDPNWSLATIWSYN